MRILLVLGIPILAVIAVVTMVMARPEPPKKERVDLDPLVNIVELESMSSNFQVSSQGTVRPRTETTLSAEVSGTITSISPKFVAGGVFARSEVLMRIDPTNYDVAVDQARALVKQRQIEFDGATKLREQGYRAESELASAAAALATAKADLVRAQRNLERTYIRVPYAGMVRSKDSDLGQFVNPGTRLGVVFATDFAEVRLPLTDLDLAFVELPSATDLVRRPDKKGPGVRLSATQRGAPAEWAATIIRSEGVVDEKSRVTYAVAEIADPYKLSSEGPILPIGTFVTANIDGLAAVDIIRVPRAVVRGSNELIFVDNDNKLRIRGVRIIRSDSRYVYVDEGARVGDQVVTTALATPINGMSVRIAGDEAAESAVESGTRAAE